jgi:hypothetical protein
MFCCAEDQMPLLIEEEEMCEGNGTRTDKEYLATIVLGLAHPGQPRVVRPEDISELLNLIEMFNKLAAKLHDNTFRGGE